MSDQTLLLGEAAEGPLAYQPMLFSKSPCWPERSPTPDGSKSWCNRSAWRAKVNRSRRLDPSAPLTSPVYSRTGPN